MYKVSHASLNTLTQLTDVDIRTHAHDSPYVSGRLHAQMYTHVGFKARLQRWEIVLNYARPSKEGKLNFGGALPSPFELHFSQQAPYLICFAFLVGEF